MNITKFLLIDVGLAIAVIPLLFFFQGRNYKLPIFRTSTKENPLDKTSSKLPSKEKILAFERLARSQGSGIEFNSLLGDWKFVSVWNKDTEDEDSVFSALLRVFSANLKLKKDISNQNKIKFYIVTSIQFGLFLIEFSGYAYLKGKQPLLIFFFNLIELKSGSRTLLSRALHEPLEKEKPFFAVIASGENGGWLSARRQGGALILWLKG